MVSRRLRCWLAAALWLAPGKVLALGVTGTLVANAGFGEPEGPGAGQTGRAAPFYWEVPNGIIPTAPFRLRIDQTIAVTLEGPGASSASGTVDVQLSTASMSPETIVVKPGTQVRFINHSGLTRALYSNGVPEFGQEPLHTAHMRVVRFPTAGVFEVGCGLRPSFRGYVVVTPNVLQSRVQPNGQFAFVEVAAGTYELKVYLRGRTVLSRTLRVVSEGINLEQIVLGSHEAAAPSVAPTPPPSDTPVTGQGHRRRRATEATVEQAPLPPPPPPPRLAPGELRPRRSSGVP